MVINLNQNHRAMNCRENGVTLIELMMVLLIFGVVMAGLYSAYSVSLKQTGQEFRLAESEMELQIAKTLLERDLAMAGHGLADDYAGLGFDPKGVLATEGTGTGSNDTLTLTGIALGRESRASQAWSYVTLATNYTTSVSEFASWTDTRENPRSQDRIIYIDPSEKKILASPAGSENTTTHKRWLFVYPPPTAGAAGNEPDNVQAGTIAYGLHSEPSGTTGNSDIPYYIVDYTLGGTKPDICAEASKSLLRAENRMSAKPNSGQPLLNCVLDFQVALGLDTDENGTMDCWDNGGVTTSAYTFAQIRKRLKQVKTYVLVQEGKKDPDFTYSNPDPAMSSTPDKIRVGDINLSPCSGTEVGSVVQLTAEQRHYHWRVLSSTVATRNIR